MAGASIDTGLDNVVIGTNADANTGANSVVALGTGATVSGTNGVAIGFGSSALAMSSVALGSDALASGDNAVAIGHMTQATDPNTIILGDGITSSYSIGVNNRNPIFALDIVGDVNITGSLVSTPLIALYTASNLNNSISRLIKSNETVDITLDNISAGSDGQELIFINISTTNTVQVIGGGNIRLDAVGDFTMNAGSTLHLILEQVLDQWIEISRTE